MVWGQISKMLLPCFQITIDPLAQVTFDDIQVDKEKLKKELEEDEKKRVRNSYLLRFSCIFLQGSYWAGNPGRAWNFSGTVDELY
jgi:hypothetical protein